MTPEKIKQLFPRASKATIDLNADSPPSGAESQRSAVDGPVAASQAKAKNSRKRLVCIVSYRVRLLDPDNLIGKWHLDALRYAGIISGDSASEIVYQISQKKVAKKAHEKTLITVE